MDLTLLQQIDESATKELTLKKDIRNLTDHLFDDAPSAEQVLEIWNNAPNINEASQAAMGRAAEREWVDSMQSDAREQQGGKYQEKGLGLNFGNSSPKIGDMVMLGRQAGVGQIVDVDPPKGEPTSVIVKSRLGEKVLQVNQLGAPKHIQGRDGKTRTAWMLGGRNIKNL